MVSLTEAAKAVVGFVPRILRHNPLVVGVRTGTLSLEAFVTSNVSLVFLDRLIHFMQGQPAVSGYLRVQNMSDLLFDSIEGDFILERLQLLICELVFPIFAKIASRGTHPDHEISGILMDPLAKVLNHVPLLPEGIRATILLTEHLEERGEILSTSRSDTSCPVEHIRGVTL